ncbi:hypothetical protein Tco_0532950 [Tanacetum coccineum]
MVTYLQKPEGSKAFHQIVDVLNSSHIKYGLIENPKIYIFLIQQFWGTAIARTTDDGEVEITASIDGQVKTIIEASLRRHLKLEDSDGITSLPNTKIFEQLALMRVDFPLFPIMITAPKSSPSKITSSPSLSPQTHQSSPLRDITRQAAEIPQSQFPTQTQVADEAAFTSVDVDAGGAATTDIGLEAGQGSGTIHKTPTRPHDSPLPRVHTLGSDEDSLQQNKLMDLVTKLTDRVKVLENDMQQTKKVYSSALTKLILRVKKLEKKVKTNKARRRVRIVISEDKDAKEDSSKQGRKISDIDKDPTILLVHPEQDMEYDFDVSTTKVFTTASVPVTTASVTPEKKSKKQLEQEILGHEEAIRLQELINEEENQRIVRDAEIAKYDPAVLRYHALQNRSFSVAEDSEIEKEVMKRPGFNFQQKSSKKRSREDSDEDNAKKQKLEDDAEKKELRDSMDVVPRDDIAIDVESLATKYPIVDWKTHVLTENMMYYQIIRADGSSKNYKIFSEMLDDFDRQDVLDLHRLVQERYDTTSPEGYDLLLWGDLKILFEPNEEDEIWKNQQDYNLISWRLFDSCGIHMLLMHTGIAIHMMIEKKYPLTQEMLSRMLSRRLEVDQESEMAFELLRSGGSEGGQWGEEGGAGAGKGGRKGGARGLRDVEVDAEGDGGGGGDGGQGGGEVHKGGGRGGITQSGRGVWGEGEVDGKKGNMGGDSTDEREGKAGGLKGGVREWWWGGDRSEEGGEAEREDNAGGEEFGGVERRTEGMAKRGLSVLPEGNKVKGWGRAVSRDGSVGKGGGKECKRVAEEVKGGEGEGRARRRGQQG